MTTDKMMKNYQQTLTELRAICAGETDPVALMATISCHLYQQIDGFDWVGFYRVVEPGLLKIGPYQGGHGCVVIPFDKGVCGAAARLKQIQLVDDVDQFEGHIACSSSTRSELVIPLFDRTGEVCAVLDIDSDQLAFFDQHDADQLDALMRDVFSAGPAHAV